MSIKATDHSIPVQTKIQEFTITVLVPNVVITTATVVNGTCGVPYTGKVNIVDGIAPFFFTIVDADQSSRLLLGETGTPALPLALPNPQLPATPAGIAKGGTSGLFLSAYDTNASTGIGTPASPAYAGRFPEGIYIRESSGDIIGTPHRRGTFSSWWFHVQSSVLPAIPGQNRWRAYTFSMSDGAPPNVALDNSVLNSGNVFGAVGNNFMQGPSRGAPYSKQFLATGGSPEDGKYDAPHEGQVVLNPSEVIGRYNFSDTFFDLQTGNLTTIGADPLKVPAGMAPTVPGGVVFSTSGLFSGVASLGSKFQTVTIVARDSLLPTTVPVLATHKASGTAQFEIGPDNVIITETSTSSSSILFDNTTDFQSQTVEVFVPSTVLANVVVRSLVAGDMVSGRTHPVAGQTPAGSLTGIDIMRVSVNPTWWAYDGYNLNARGARTMQHDDPQRRHYYEPFGSDFSYPVNESTPSLHDQGKEHAAEPAIEIPNTVSSTLALPTPITVTANVANGIYTDGGLLYAYDNPNPISITNPTGPEFGFFIVRKDARIDIPVAFNKASSGFAGFGDAVLTSSTALTGMCRIPQITVSPDGRMAAVKMKQNVDLFNETATNEKIVVFSLTGEKMFGGSTFLVLSTGGTGTGAGTAGDGQYLYGSALTLTNYSLYSLRGNNIGGISGSQDRVIYGEHWVYRARIFDPASTSSSPSTYPNYLAPTTTALLAPGFGGVGGWINTANNPVSCCFQRWSSPGSSQSIFGYGNTIPNDGSVSMSQAWEAPASSLTGGQQANFGGSLVSVSPDFWHFSYANFGDNSAAPHPFRVSQNGRACVIVAGANQSASVSTFTSVAGFLNRSVYVDFDNNFREAANVVRRYKSASRTVGLYTGEPINRLYGWFDGPATQLEVSDDGQRISVVYNASTTAWSTLMRNNVGNTDTREELAYFAALGSLPDPWVSKTNTLVTNPGPQIFGTNINWRIGCLAYTRNNGALTFWAGAPLNSGNLYNYQYADGCCLAGTMYAYTPSTNTLEGILPAAQGGHSDVFNAASSRVYSTGSPNTLVQSGATAAAGCVRPTGSFLSNDGNFYWVECGSALDTTNNKGNRCIAVNVKDTTTTINGRLPIRAFAPAWPAARPFSVGSSYFYSFPGFLYYAGMTQNKVASHISAGGTNGLIFYAAYNQTSTNTGKSNSNSYWQGGADALTTGWGHYYGNNDGAELYGLDTSLGGSPTALSALGLAQRAVSYIQPSPDGKRVAFQTTAITPSNQYETLPGSEQLRIVSAITVSATGVLSATAPVVLEGVNGRVSSSVALDTTGTKVFYAFSSTGNENGMVLKETTLNSGGTAIVGVPRTFNGAGNVPARFAVLWSGR